MITMAICSNYRVLKFAGDVKKPLLLKPRENFPAGKEGHRRHKFNHLYVG